MQLLPQVGEPSPTGSVICGPSCCKGGDDVATPTPPRDTVGVFTAALAESDDDGVVLSTVPTDAPCEDVTRDTVGDETDSTDDGGARIDASS